MNEGLKERLGPESGEAAPFSAWSVESVSRAPGVYTIWRRDEFVYVGMAGDLRTRLRSHASGRRSGDQFNLYVCDRYVVPHLATDELTALAAGDRSLDDRTKAYVRTHLGFRYVETPSVVEARLLEAEIREHGLAAHGRPLLNPHTRAGPD